VKQLAHELTVPTRGRGLVEISDSVRAFVRKTGVQTGLLTIFLRHTSASLLIQENADPEVQSDLERFFACLAPDGDERFEHRAEGPDDMPAHVRTALTTVQLGIPVLRGEPVLGTWQGVYVWEHRRQPHQRRVVLHLLGE
jgi:secondary thiamine-phosphate synthase enzyme